MARDMAALRARQEELAKRVVLTGDWPPDAEPETVGAADVSCGRFSKTGYAAVLVFSYPDLTLLCEATAEAPLDFPYIPGYLAFREFPPIERCLNDLPQWPQILVCDGQGIAHPRRIGIASHIGAVTGLATIGCAKTRLIGEHAEPGEKRGCVADLMDRGEKIGEVVRTRDRVKPLFVSPGHRIGFQRATRLILDLCRNHRQPEPIRAAHNRVNELRRLRNDAKP